MFPTGDVLTLTLGILGFIAALAGTQLLAAALLPGAVERSQAHLRARPWKSALAGAGVLVASLLLGAGLGLLGGPGQLLRLLLVGGVLVFAFTGLAAFSRVVGAGLPSAVDDRSPWRATLRGALVWEFAYVIPVFGWLLFGLTVLTAGGAGTLGCIGAMRTRRPDRIDETDAIDAAFRAEELEAVA